MGRLSSPPQLSPSDAVVAELRLREAEERLKEAIEELQRRKRGTPDNLHLPCDHAVESCVANAVGNLCQNFLLSYGIREGSEFSSAPSSSLASNPIPLSLISSNLSRRKTL